MTRVCVPSSHALQLDDLSHSSTGSLMPQVRAHVLVAWIQTYENWTASLRRV